MKINKSIGSIIILGLITLVGGCSKPTQPDHEQSLAEVLAEMELKPANKVERIRDYRVDSWRYIDPYNLIIKAGIRDQYLISLRTPCPELRSALQIGFTSTAGTLDKFEDIIVSDRFTGNQRCGISDIVKLESIPASPEGQPPE